MLLGSVKVRFEERPAFHEPSEWLLIEAPSLTVIASRSVLNSMKLLPFMGSSCGIKNGAYVGVSFICEKNQ